MGSRSVEQLGLELQHVTKRAFPTIVGKDYSKVVTSKYWEHIGRGS